MRAERKLNQSENIKGPEASGLVSSSQAGIHPRLDHYVRRHLETPWRQPLHQPTVEIYGLLEAEGVFCTDQKLILDSGCGTGKSTRQLARLFPRHLVMGVDRSYVRLAKSGVKSGMCRNDNNILLRAELSTFWRLMSQNGHLPERHFLFYPNPWPKPDHLLRRWHGHPVFPQLLCLGGEIELRCNWEIYALEFARAVNIATGGSVGVISIQPEHGVSPFEQKYLERGHALYSVLVPAETTRIFRLSQQKG